MTAIRDPHRSATPSNGGARRGAKLGEPVARGSDAEHRQLPSGGAISGAALAGSARSSELALARGGVEPPIEVRVRPRYNPSLDSATYIVPGIVGVLLSLTMVMITSLAIVRERERGTLEQLIVAPIDKTSLMLGKIVPFVLVGYVQMTVVLLLARLMFDVPMRGSIPLLYALTAAFIVANLGLGRSCRRS